MYGVLSLSVGITVNDSTRMSILALEGVVFVVSIRSTLNSVLVERRGPCLMTNKISWERRRVYSSTPNQNTRASCGHAR